MVDASYGFEMETFEFLNICQVHGMPRILGILNHLDLLDGISKVCYLITKFNASFRLIRRRK